ncbi:MAG: hypothetical protein H6725_05950 [Sandaracinaceae bacterium]|nr:hypothetical protein [Sandaracinaceae bacterium]
MRPGDAGFTRGALVAFWAAGFLGALDGLMGLAVLAGLAVAALVGFLGAAFLVTFDVADAAADFTAFLGAAFFGAALGAFLATFFTAGLDAAVRVPLLARGAAEDAPCLDALVPLARLLPLALLDELFDALTTASPGAAG